MAERSHANSSKKRAKNRKHRQVSVGKSTEHCGAVAITRNRKTVISNGICYMQIKTVTLLSFIISIVRALALANVETGLSVKVYCSSINQPTSML